MKCPLLGHLIVGFFLVSLGGCTQYWAKPGGTPAEFEATKAACQGRAFSQFPPVLQQIQLTAGYVTPVHTNCVPIGYSVSCTSTGGQYVPPAYMTVDQNQSGRGAAFRSCLYQAGWQPVKDKAEAEAVTNSMPMQPSLPMAPGPDTSWKMAWDEARKLCNDEAGRAQSKIPFADGFDTCMKKHGY